jgi:very-short-patch-repair endonuclease
VAKLPKALSPGEEELALHLRVNNIPFQREVCLIPGRKWRVDFLLGNLVVEVEGGTWIQGRHNRGSSVEKDFEKYNALTLAGFSVLRFTTEMVQRGDAIETIMQVAQP